MNKMLGGEKRHNRLIYGFLSLVLMTYFAFGINHINKFLTADEHYWIYERIPQYWDATASGNFKKTYINDKPGVSIALVSGFGYFSNYSEMRAGIEQNKDIKSLDPHKDDNLRDNLMALRLPLLIFNGAFMILFFWLIKRLTENDWIALMSVIFAACSPILIGISQIINPDALLWSLSTGAIFSYLNLLKSEEKKFIALTAVLTGMAILTKYVANILFLFYIFLLAYYLMTAFGNKLQPGLAKKYALKQLAYYGIIIMGSLATATILMPAVFVKITYLQKLTLDFSGLQKTLWLIGAGIIFILTDAFLKNRLTIFFQKYILRKDIVFRIISLILFLVFACLLFGRNVNPDWNMFQNIPFDIKNLSDIKDAYYPNIANLLLLEFSPLVFSLTPITLILILALWLSMLYKKNDHAFPVFSLSFFILLYYFGSIFSDTLATIRYSVMLYPLIAFLAGVSFWEISRKIKDFPYKNVVLVFGALIISIASLWMIKPYYFNYTNALLPKNQIITDSWGYGGYEAAEFINSQPDAKNLTVWSDFYGVCEFIQGKCLTKYSINRENTKIDYYVLTRRGKIRLKGNRDGAGAKQYYSLENADWELFIDGRPDNYIKIFKATNQ